MVGHSPLAKHTAKRAQCRVFPSSISYTPQGKVCWQPQLSMFMCMCARVYV